MSLDPRDVDKNGILSPEEAFANVEAPVVAPPGTPVTETTPIVPKLELKDCSQSFVDPNGTLKEVVKGITITIEGPQLIAILGPSGCGKSTILRFVSGLYGKGGTRMPTTGEVYLNGELTEGPRNEVLTVFQAPVLARWRSVLGNVMLSFQSGIRMHRKAHPWEVPWDFAADLVYRIAKKPLIPFSPLTREIYERSVEMLNDVGLGDSLHKYPHELSGGMKQRASLATVLAVRPQVMCMDEPYSALDPTTKVEMRTLLRDLRKKHPCLALLVTHDVTEALELADRVIVLSAKPATIIGDIQLPKDRPNDWRKSAEHKILEDKLLQMLRDAKGSGSVRVEI